MIFALLGALTTSCSVVLFRFLLRNGENPLNLSVWVNMLSLPVWIFLFQKHTSEFRKLSSRDIALLIFIGIAGAMGINYLQFLALKNTTAVNFAFIYRTVTVFTVLFAWIFLKEKITWIKGLLVAFIIIGSYLVTTEGKMINLTIGDFYSLLMAASAAFISNILVKHTVSKMHPDLSGSVATIVGCASLLILGLLMKIIKIPNGFLLVLLGSVFYFCLIMFRNRAYLHASASFVTMVFALSPLFVSVLSFFFLGEVLKPVQLIGGAIIILATIFAERFKV